MPVSPARRRILERRVAAGAIGLAALFAVMALAFRFVIPDAWFSFEFPPAPGRGLEAFNLYLWLWLVLKGFILATILGAIGRVLTRRRGATAWIGLALPVVICLGAAVLHAAFYGITIRRVDRLARDVEEPSLVAQALAVSGTVTFVLAACFLCVTSLRRTPPSVRQAARTVAATLTGVVLILFWLQMILPMSNGWEPVRWDAPELLVPVRPCRGATLWQPSAKCLRPPYRFAVIDDVWLHSPILGRTAPPYGRSRPPESGKRRTTGSTAPMSRRCSSGRTIPPSCAATRVRGWSRLPRQRGIGWGWSKERGAGSQPPRDASAPGVLRRTILIMRNSVRGVVLLALVLYAASALACSCFRRLSPAEKFTRAELVFAGKVIEVEDRNTVLRRFWRSLRSAVGVPEPRFTDWTEWGFDVTLQVTAMWRGEGVREMRLLTGRGGGDCGIRFAEGETYLVYAYRHEGRWYAHLCSGTRLTRHAAKDLAWLATRPKVRLP
jgi:hypothetical protein